MADPITDIVAKPVEALASMAFKKIKSEDLDSTIEQLGSHYCSINDTLQKRDPFEARSDIKRLELIQDELDGFFTELAAKTGVQREVLGSPGFTAKVCSFLSSPKQHVLRFKYVEKVNDFTSNLKSLASVIDLSKTIAVDPSGNESWPFSEDSSPFPGTDVLIGRDKDKENIINLLRNYSVVAIVGVGGQGKTTLAQYVCQDDRVKGSFDLLLWVYVTPQSSVKKILEKIITSATGEKPTYYGLEQLYRQVLQTIVGKRCLLVLDNVSYGGKLRHDLEALNAILKQGEFWGNGGKVLITTRSKATVKLIGMSKAYKLRDLAGHDSWILLRHYAIQQEQEDKKEFGIEEIGKEIANLCPKVPLVLKVVGCHLAYRDYKSQWERFRNELASNPIMYMSRQHEKIKQILKHCYNQLDNNLKHCAAYCSLFPKGHEYDKNYMVRTWIALGFVESRDEMSLEDVGDAYVIQLTHRAFFEEADNIEVFKMHDVMHDLMCLIAKDKHQMIDSKTEHIVEGVRHVSMNAQDLNWEVLLSSSSDKQKLQSTVMVWSAADNLFHGVPLGAGIGMLILANRRLRVLDIRHQWIVEVPRWISELTYLRYLNLSHNPLINLPDEITKCVRLQILNLSGCHNLRELPEEMDNLKNLMYLDLSWCRDLQKLPSEMGELVYLKSLSLEECCNIKQLPRDMGKLVNLRHLWVKGCKLRCMPKGFGNLTNLLTLDVFVVGGSGSDGEGGAKLEELGHLNNLQGNLCIKLAGQSKDIVSQAGEARLEKKTELSKFKIVFEKKGEEDQKFLEGIHLCGETLEELSIKNYGGKRLPAWMVDDRFHESFPKLHSLVLLRSNKMNSHNKSILKHSDEFMRFTVQGNEDDLVEWIPRYSKLREQLKIGTIELRARKRDVPRLTDVRDLTLHDVCFSIEKELAPRSGEIRESGLLQSSFPNLTKLELRDIPELEELPEEFEGLTSLVSLIIDDCLKLKAMPDWIDTFSSLKHLTIDNAPELKVLPDSICNLTSLVVISLWDCTGLELLPHQLSNLQHCRLNIH